MIQSRRDQVRGCSGAGSGFFARNGSGSASTSPLQGLPEAQNRPFHLVDQLLGRLQALYQVRDRRFRCRLNRFRFRKRLQTNETANEFRTQVLAFFVFSSSGLDLELEEPQNGLRPFGEFPAAVPCAGGVWTSPDPLCPYLRAGLSGQHRPSDGVLFSGSDEIGPGGAKNRRYDRIGGFLLAERNRQSPSMGPGAAPHRTRHPARRWTSPSSRRHYSARPRGSSGDSVIIYALTAARIFWSVSFTGDISVSSRVILSLSSLV